MAVTRDQTATGTAVASVSTTTVVWPTLPTAGSKAVVVVHLGDSASFALTSAKDNGTVQSTFTADYALAPVSGTNSGHYILRADSISLPSSGNYTVTLNFAGTVDWCTASGRTYRGVTPGAPTGTNANNGTSASASTGNVTPAVTGALIAGGFSDNSSSNETITLTTSGASGIFTETNGVSLLAGAVADNIATTTSAQGLAWTISPDTPNWRGAVAVYSPAATTSDTPNIQPGPVWFDLFKPGMPRPRPLAPPPPATALEQGPLAVTLPVPVTSLSGTNVLPLDMPAIQPGPTWFDTFKPGMRRPRPFAPALAEFEISTLALVLPVPVTLITGTVARPIAFTQVVPGPTWLDMFKPGLPRPRPQVPPPPNTKLIPGPLSVILPGPVTSISSIDLRQPENLGAVLTLPSPNGMTVEVVESATCTLLDIDATLVLPSPNATLVGWTMLTAPLTLSEFNDVTIDIAVTQNGSPYNLAGVTVNLLFKSAAGTPDGNALIFSSGGGSPAITITNSAGGLAVAVIPNTDLDAEVYFFYRLDVVNSGLTNTCLYGPINWISL